MVMFACWIHLMPLTSRLDGLTALDEAYDNTNFVVV